MVKPKQKSGKFTLEQLQALVNGYIKILPRICHCHIDVVNEEGLLRNMEHNKEASRLCYQRIVGPLIHIPIEEWDDE